MKTRIRLLAGVSAALMLSACVASEPPARTETRVVVRSASPSASGQPVRYRQVRRVQAPSPAPAAAPAPAPAAAPAATPAQAPAPAAPASSDPCVVDPGSAACAQQILGGPQGDSNVGGGGGWG